MITASARKISEAGRKSVLANDMVDGLMQVIRSAERDLAARRF